MRIKKIFLSSNLKKKTLKLKKFQHKIADDFELN